MKRYRLALTVLLALLFCMPVSPCALAAEAGEGVKEYSVSFSDFSQMAENEKMEKIVTDSNGNIAIVGIERVIDGRSCYSAGSTWRVWFTGVTINAEFYMTVSNNTVTSVFDDTISVIGGTYEDDELTMTSTYGKLSFKVTSLGSIMSGKYWLKGTVTGSEDKIDVSWRM